MQSGAAIGGDGAILGSLTLSNGAKLVFDLNNVGLTVGGTFSLDSSFGITNLVSPTLAAIDWSMVSFGTYTLVNTTTVFNAGNIENFGISNAFFSGGKQMYFENGSLNLVVAVPEPSTLALVGLGLAGVLILGRRSRS